jgi:soluble lytic murein transglycosylase-like protein
VTNARFLFGVLLAVLWLTFGNLALAQSAIPAPDPFAGIHARLAQAANTSLEALRSAPQTEKIGIAGAIVEQDRKMTAAVPDISLARVRVAQARFLDLRVDAARIFVEEGVPLELLVVAEVESGFDPQAISPKGARGPWQLMPATAERFGLRVDKLVDERTQPQLSTRAAARYLRELHEQFGDWLLALAAYNAGEQRVAKAVERGGTRDFWQLSQQRLLPEETRRYVPAVLNSEIPR